MCFHSVSAILNHPKVFSVNLLVHCLSGFTKALLQHYQQSELIKSEIQAFSLNVRACVRSVSRDKLLLSPMRQFPLSLLQNASVEGWILCISLRGGSHKKKTNTELHQCVHYIFRSTAAINHTDGLLETLIETYWCGKRLRLWRIITQLVTHTVYTQPTEYNVHVRDVSRCLYI